MLQSPQKRREKIVPFITLKKWRKPQIAEELCRLRCENLQEVAFARKCIPVYLLWILILTRSASKVVFGPNWCSLSACFFHICFKTQSALDGSQAFLRIHWQLSTIKSKLLHVIQLRLDTLHTNISEFRMHQMYGIWRDYRANSFISVLLLNWDVVSWASREFCEVIPTVAPHFWPSGLLLVNECRSARYVSSSLERTTPHWLAFDGCYLPSSLFHRPNLVNCGARQLSQVKWSAASYAALSEEWEVLQCHLKLSYPFSLPFRCKYADRT